MISSTMSLTGATSPAGINGISILPALLGRQQKTDDRFLYWEFPGGKLQQAVRWRSYKAVRLAPGRPLELYNLAEDIAEEHEIAAEHPEIAAKIEQYLRTARTDSPNWPA